MLRLYKDLFMCECVCECKVATGEQGNCKWNHSFIYALKPDPTFCTNLFNIHSPHIGLFGLKRSFCSIYSLSTVLSRVYTLSQLHTVSLHWWDTSNNTSTQTQRVEHPLHKHRKWCCHLIYISVKQEAINVCFPFSVLVDFLAYPLHFPPFYEQQNDHFIA